MIIKTSRIVAIVSLIMQIQGFSFRNRTSQSGKNKFQILVKLHCFHEIHIFLHFTETVFKDAENCFENFDYPGNDVTHFTHGVVGEKACQLKCQENDQCSFWTYDVNYQNCWLKNGKSKLRVPPNPCISGPKFCQKPKVEQPKIRPKVEQPKIESKVEQPNGTRRFANKCYTDPKCRRQTLCEIAFITCLVGGTASMYLFTIHQCIKMKNVEKRILIRKKSKKVEPYKLNLHYAHPSLYTIFEGTKC